MLKTLMSALQVMKMRCHFCCFYFSFLQIENLTRAQIQDFLSVFKKNPKYLVTIFVPYRLKHFKHRAEVSHGSNSRSEIETAISALLKPKVLQEIKRKR